MPRVISKSEDLLWELGGMPMLLDHFLNSYPSNLSPVGSGKTALTLALCRLFRAQYNIGVHSLQLCAIPNR